MRGCYCFSQSSKVVATVPVASLKVASPEHSGTPHVQKEAPSIDVQVEKTTVTTECPSVDPQLCSSSASQSHNDAADSRSLVQDRKAISATPDVLAPMCWQEPPEEVAVLVGMAPLVQEARLLIPSHDAAPEVVVIPDGVAPSSEERVEQVDVLALSDPSQEDEHELAVSSATVPVISVVAPLPSEGGKLVNVVGPGSACLLQAPTEQPDDHLTSSFMSQVTVHSRLPGGRSRCSTPGFHSPFTGSFADELLNEPTEMNQAAVVHGEHAMLEAAGDHNLL